jgi:hypothetical protein
VILDGIQDEEEKHFIQTSTVAMINLQTGKVNKMKNKNKKNFISFRWIK